ncbi:MAG: hypothetical protein L3I99_07695 [Sulfurimonas sp.]|nr:hypothetical protein [Sulfurimonas sp.]
MKNIIPIVKNLISETEQVEIIRYKSAYEKFSVYSEMMFEKVSDGKLRLSNHREDTKYFKKLKIILDENDFKDPKRTLELLREVESRLMGV